MMQTNHKKETINSEKKISMLKSLNSSTTKYKTNNIKVEEKDFNSIRFPDLVKSVSKLQNYKGQLLTIQDAFDSSDQGTVHPKNYSLNLFNMQEFSLNMPLSNEATNDKVN
jgi:hypothetical protein